MSTNKSSVQLKEKMHIDTLLPLAVLAIMFCLNAWFLIVRGRAYVDSDMASNFLAAVNNNSEKVILSKNWYYSTAASIFKDINVYQLVLLVIKDNWYLTRAIGVLIMQICLIASFVIFAGLLHINWKKAVLFSAFLISPICYWLFLMIGFGGYYIQNTNLALITMISLLWYTKIDDDEKIKRLTCVSIAFLVAIVSGINGIKSVMFPYGPLVVATFLICFITLRSYPEKIKDSSCFEWKWVKISTISMLGFAVGYIINVVYISKNYFFESKDRVTWAPLNLSNVFSGISDCLALLGYQNDEHLNFIMRGEMSRSIFSIQGIANLFGILLIVFFIFSVIRLVMRFDRLNDEIRALIYMFIAALFVGVIIFKFTEGYTTTPAYWVPVYPVMLLIILAEIETEEYRFDISKIVVTLTVALSVIITSFSTFKLYQERPLYANPQMVNIADWLEGHGYKQGYATFWQSNVLTFLTDGNIEMWTVHGFDNLELDKWQQKMSHDERPQGEKIFALIGPDDELDRDVFLQYMNTEPGMPEIVYQDEEGYIVVEYK